jgi:hypothetical protein
MVRLTVDYGYDIHSIDLDDDVYAKIKAGEKIQIDGQGFFHEVDGEVQDFWSFNANVGEICFMLDNGAEFHALDYWIEEYQGGRLV